MIQDQDKIKKFKEYLKESKKVPVYEYGIVKIDLGIKDWKKLISTIDKSDLYEPDPSYGIEETPHLTLLYGLDKDVSFDDVKECFKNIKGPVKIESSGISIFENPEFDVVKLSVKKTKILEDIFQNLSKLPNSNTFKTYIPHVTIAYVKPGKGKKYVDANYSLIIDNITEIKYSKPKGAGKERFRLNI